MLTADLVRVQKRNGELKLLPFDARRRAKAEDLAASYLSIYREMVGSTREEIEDSVKAVEIDPRDRLLARGLEKLIQDRSEFDTDDTLDPERVRELLFGLAAVRRRALGPEDRFDRAAVLAEVAAELGAAPEAVERALFADLRGAQILRSVEPISPQHLVEAYVTGRAQAVLLRAVRVRVDVECGAPAAYRALFGRMKFLRLLHTITPAETGFRLEIDGPMSLFGPSTKYGLELASLLPVLEGCDHYTLEADVRWSGPGEQLLFRSQGGLREGEAAPALPAAELPDEVAALLERLRGDPTWKVEVANEVLELPGAGLCVPDLVFTRAEPPARAYLEVMGHWSRAAVWRRVELVEKGLAAPIVFAVSTRLRVSEEALGEDLPAALYVYKGAIAAKAVLEKIAEVAARAPTPAAAPPRRARRRRS